MTKTELIAEVAEKTGLKKKDAEAAVAAVLTAVEEKLAAGEKVQLVGFGTFEVKERPEREGRNPATGATIKIGRRKAPGFHRRKGSPRQGELKCALTSTSKSQGL